MSALARYRGALLAESVGSGKTWIALAVAAADATPVVVIGPAILQGQWEAAAARARVPISWWSHERLSRGQLPPVAAGLVIIDEAHRLRDPAAVRVRTVAPWLTARRVLLLTATPIVNRVDDLVTLLRLVLPEDALRFDGVPTLGHLTDCEFPPPGLRRVMIRTAHGEMVRRATGTALEVSSLEAARAERAVTTVDRLTRRHRAGWARLLAAVLLDAAASSDVALRAALRRYRALLCQARDSGFGDRELLRRFAGRALEQTVLWELVGSTSSDTALAVDDLPILDALLTDLAPADASWLDAVRRCLSDETPTVCFTRHRDTATLLRTTLGDGTAWITGDAAGIGPHRLPREALLAAFGPGRTGWSLRQRVPRVLVATDVAAEGLDFQAAGRIVHVDLPWTAMRVAQREGRLLRLGQEHAEVHIVVRTPAPAIEAALRRVARVARKGALTEQWLGALAVERCHAAPAPCHGTPWLVLSTAKGTPPRDLVLLSIAENGGTRAGTMAAQRTGAGHWQLLAADPTRLMQGAAIMHPTETRAEMGAIVESASRWALRELIAPASWGPPRLVARIHRLARGAAWRRDADALGRLDRLLRWCTAPPTLGARLRIDQLAAAGDAELLRHDAPLTPAAAPVTVTAIALVLFRSAPPPLR
jgi:hypothetical protein